MKNFWNRHREKDVENIEEEARAEEQAQAKELKHEWFEKFEEEQLLRAMKAYITSNSERWRMFQMTYPVHMKDFDERFDRIMERTERESEILGRMMRGDI